MLKLKNSPSENRRRVFFISKLVFVSENVFHVPVPVAVAPDPVQVPVAANVEPPVFSYKNIIMMVSELMQRFVMFDPDRGRWRNIWFWGSLNAGYTHDTSQNYNCHCFSQHIFHINYLLAFLLSIP